MPGVFAEELQHVWATHLPSKGSILEHEGILPGTVNRFASHNSEADLASAASKKLLTTMSKTSSNSLLHNLTTSFFSLQPSAVSGSSSSTSRTIRNYVPGVGGGGVFLHQHGAGTNPSLSVGSLVDVHAKKSGIGGTGGSSKKSCFFALPTGQDGGGIVAPVASLTSPNEGGTIVLGGTTSTSTTGTSAASSFLATTSNATTSTHPIHPVPATSATSSSSGRPRTSFAAEGGRSASEVAHPDEEEESVVKADTLLSDPAGHLHGRHRLENDPASTLQHDDQKTTSQPHGEPGAQQDEGSSNPNGPSSFLKQESLPRDAAIRVDMLNNNNSQYYGDFFLGTPPQPFTAVMDTGSGLVWVPGKKCSSQVCLDHHQYDGQNSKTRGDIPAEEGVTTAIHYGTGSVHYQQSEDTLRLCDSKLNPNCRDVGKNILTIPKQAMGTSLDQTDEPFKWLPFDGIFGLAPSASKGSALASIKKSGALANNLMGCYLSEDTHRVGSLSFGGIEDQYIAKGHPLYWHSITHPREWQVAIQDIEVDGELQHACDNYPNGECTAVVDTGSSLVTGPSSEMEPILEKLRIAQETAGGYHQEMGDDGNSMMPNTINNSSEGASSGSIQQPGPNSCANVDNGKMPTVSLLIKGSDGLIRYPLTPQDYTLANINDQTDQPECELGFGSMDVPGKKWVIGDTFLRRYYSIYDDDQHRVGFVRSVHPGETNAPPAKHLAVGASPTEKLPRVAVAGFANIGGGGGGGVATSAIVYGALTNGINRIFHPAAANDQNNDNEDEDEINSNHLRNRRSTLTSARQPSQSSSRCGRTREMREFL
ncbi:unnamed protein product [Amoebophrya sp. A25]|nr:unnamed protein product [Amoebophrya sp. A25]|eukprot:GSA25T00016945001.1